MEIDAPFQSQSYEVRREMERMRQIARRASRDLKAADAALASQMQALSDNLAQVALGNITLAQALQNVAATVPLPASAMPPAIADTGAVGTVTKYAKEDHKHKSNVQWKEVLVSPAGQALWTFDTPFNSPPYIIATALTPKLANGQSPTYLNMASPEPATNESVVIRVVQVQQTLTLPTLATSLLGLVLNLFAPATAGVKVHCIARPL